MYRVMKHFEVNILDRRPKTVDNIYYAMCEFDMMTKSYTTAWKKFGIIIIIS